MLPNDPMILVSYLNTKLRDFYDDLEAMCYDMNLNRFDIEEKLRKADFVYDKQTNQFI